MQSMCSAHWSNSSFLQSSYDLSSLGQTILSIFDIMCQGTRKEKTWLYTSFLMMLLEKEILTNKTINWERKAWVVRNKSAYRWTIIGTLRAIAEPQVWRAPGYSSCGCRKTNVVESWASKELWRGSSSWQGICTLIIASYKSNRANEKIRPLLILGRKK